MNIFVLDYDPALAAEYQCDKHVVKMILESAQLMSTVNHKLGLPAPYKPTHANHPCTLWAEKAENFVWLFEHFKSLCSEYTRRYGRIHKCQQYESMFAIEKLSPPTSFVQCMPDECKRTDPVEAYREYYRKHKLGFARWTNRDVPAWI